MEWYIMNAHGFQSLSGHLGQLVGDTYIVDDDCIEMLELIYAKLHEDDPTSCLVRRHILMSRILRTDIVPLVKHCSGDVEILSLCARLLSELSKPVGRPASSPLSADVAFDMQSLAADIRDVLHDEEFVSVLFSEISTLAQEAVNSGVSDIALELMKSTLQLFHNVLDGTQGSDRQDLIRCLLLRGLTDFLLYAVNSPQRRKLVLPAVGIMWLVYSDFEWQDVSSSCEDEITADDYKKRFVVQMLQHGLGHIVTTLQEIMLSAQSRNKCVDDKYYFWLIGYFLRHHEHVNVSLLCLKDVLSKDCIGFLVYKSVEHWEQLMLTHGSTCQGSTKVAGSQPQRSANTSFEGEKALQRVRLGLAVSALTAVLKVIKRFEQMALDDDGVAYLTALVGHLISMKELRNSLLLLVRCYSSSVMPVAFLIAVVRLNHRLLTLSECFMQCHGPSHPLFDMQEHISQFACPRVMQAYSSLAHHFSSNDSELNAGVFTMMDHVARDCGRVDVLLQRSVAIDTFMRLTPDNALPQDCELAEFVLHSFLSQLESEPARCLQVCAELVFGKQHLSTASAIYGLTIPSYGSNDDSGLPQPAVSSGDCNTGMASEDPQWSNEERDDMFELYLKLNGENAACPKEGALRACDYENLAEALERRGHSRRSTSDIVARLVADGLVSVSATAQQALQPSHFSTTDINSHDPNAIRAKNRNRNETVAECVASLSMSVSGRTLLAWLSEQLAGMAEAKLMAAERASSKATPSSAAGSRHVSSITHYSILRNMDVPLITYAEEQEQAVANRGPFRSLLSALEFVMPGPKSVFARMHVAWSACEARAKARLVDVPAQGSCDIFGKEHCASSIDFGAAREESPQPSKEDVSEVDMSCTDCGEQDCKDRHVSSMEMTGLTMNQGMLGLTMNQGMLEPCGSSTSAFSSETTPNLWLLYMQRANS